MLMFIRISADYFGLSVLCSLRYRRILDSFIWGDPSVGKMLGHSPAAGAPQQCGDNLNSHTMLMLLRHEWWRVCDHTRRCIPIRAWPFQSEKHLNQQKKRSRKVIIWAWWAWRRRRSVFAFLCLKPPVKCRSVCRGFTRHRTGVAGPFYRVSKSPLVDPVKVGDLVSPVALNPSWDLEKSGRKNLQVFDNNTWCTVSSSGCWGWNMIEPAKINLFIFSPTSVILFLWFSFLKAVGLVGLSHHAAQTNTCWLMTLFPISMCLYWFQGLEINRINIYYH